MDNYVGYWLIAKVILVRDAMQTGAYVKVDQVNKLVDLFFGKEYLNGKGRYYGCCTTGCRKYVI